MSEFRCSCVQIVCVQIVREHSLSSSQLSAYNNKICVLNNKIHTPKNDCQTRIMSRLEE